MNRPRLFLVPLCLCLVSPVSAIDAKYATQLERSGCTQLTELQGCDITKTREENAAAGFGPAAPAAAGAPGDAANASPTGTADGKP